VRDERTHPHRPRLVVSHSTCPPLSSSPPREQLCNRSCSNKHTRGGHGKPLSFTFASGARPPLQDRNGRQAWDSGRRVTVNNIQVMLVCGRPGDRGGGTETPAASVQYSVPRQYSVFSNCSTTVTVSPSGPPGLFKGVTTAMSGVLARFPLLVPVRNSCAP